MELGHTPTHKSTFGVHYRTGSPGQLGLRDSPGRWIPGSLGSWVTKCARVPCLVGNPIHTAEADATQRQDSFVESV